MSGSKPTIAELEAILNDQTQRVAITPAGDVVVHALEDVLRIGELEKRRDELFAEVKRAQGIIDRLTLQREKMLTSSLGRDWILLELRSWPEHPEHIADRIEGRFNRIVFEALGDGVGNPSNAAPNSSTPLAAGDA